MLAGGVGDLPVLVPMVHGAFDQDEGLAGRAVAARGALVESVRAGGAPGVDLAVDVGEAWAGDAFLEVSVETFFGVVWCLQRGLELTVTAVFVDPVDIGWGCDVESFPADGRRVLEIYLAGNDGELVIRDAGAGL